MVSIQERKRGAYIDYLDSPQTSQSSSLINPSTQTRIPTTQSSQIPNFPISIIETG